MRWQNCVEPSDRRLSIARLVGPFAAAALSTAAAAQQAAPDCARVAEGTQREMRSGMCLRSTIDAADLKNADEVPYEDWRLSLGAGEGVQIDMDSIASPPPADRPATDSAQTEGDIESFPFDTYLEIRRDGSAEALDANDDRPGSLNSTLVFTAAQAGVYIVRARPLSAYAGMGDYTLRVGPPPAPPAVVALAVGRNIVPPPDAAGAAVQERLFSFEGRRGERVRLTLDRRGAGDQLVLNDPDSGVIGFAGAIGSDISILTVLPRDGTYQVQVQVNNSERSPGPQVLSLEKIAPVAERAPRPIRGETVDGEIGIRSPAARDPFGGSLLLLHELFELPVTASETVTVLLDSADFDPVLDAGVLSPVGFAIAASDDDGGERLGSRLVLRPDRSGQVILRVRALGNGIGNFRLRVVPGEAPPPAE